MKCLYEKTLLKDVSVKAKEFVLASYDLNKLNDISILHISREIYQDAAGNLGISLGNVFEAGLYNSPRILLALFTGTMAAYKKILTKQFQNFIKNDTTHKS